MQQRSPVSDEQDLVGQEELQPTTVDEQIKGEEEELQQNLPNGDEQGREGEDLTRQMGESNREEVLWVWNCFEVMSIICDLHQTFEEDNCLAMEEIEEIIKCLTFTGCTPLQNQYSFVNELDKDAIHCNHLASTKHHGKGADDQPSSGNILEDEGRGFRSNPYVDNVAFSLPGKNSLHLKLRHIASLLFRRL